MALTNIRHIFLKNGFSYWALVIIAIVFFASDMVHHKWMKDQAPQRAVIKHDVKGYYSYVPAIFIFGDHKLEFTGAKGFKNDGRFQYLRIEKDKRLIQYTSGLAILYTPFFLTAHATAPLFGQERDGYNWVYQFFLVISALFYVMLGLVFLRKLLLKYFSDLVVAGVLLLLVFGTNLFYYTVYEGPMPHSYSFAFIALFLYFVDRWYAKPDVIQTIILGFVYGMVVLIRPTNALVIIVLLFCGIKDFNDIQIRIKFLLRKTPLILLMIVFFIIPWIPQLLYWKSVTGSFFYNSYESVGSEYYIYAPQTLEMLFSYRKGWFVYTPIMFIGLIGFVFLFRNYRKIFWSTALYMVVMIYVLSSWWAWWFGGSFGSRSMVDTYAIMSIPLAALLVKIVEERRKKIQYSILAVLILLVGLQWLQTSQYNHGSIHYVSMDKDAYWHNYLKIKHRGVWSYLSEPDHQLARLGIYYYYDWGADYDSFRELPDEEAKRLIGAELTSSPKMMRSIKRHAGRNGMEDFEAMEMVIDRVYEMKMERENLK
ncbi:MAG: hypothetical protein PF450_05825 [Bacteroidales bacterium]|jgi:hypothetical protein|nr:hypothetical protein [Bacteroidales bacterium]